MNLTTEINSRQSYLKLYSYKHAIVAGIGGIGSWVALDLALSGQVRKLHIIDDDIVERTNLNRTPFRIQDIGCAKVDALKYLILERRIDVIVETYVSKTNSSVLDLLMSRMEVDVSFDTPEIIDDVLIIDCRDDVFDDLYDINCKYYKVGYDGLSVTIDGNPRNTAVWGESNNYRFTPSFIAPAQMIAAAVVTDALAIQENGPNGEPPRIDVSTTNQAFDLKGRINTSFTIDTRDIISTLYQKYLKGTD